MRVESRRHAEIPIAAVAAKAPTVELVFHDKLGPDAAKRRLWSAWGDICVASDGKVSVSYYDVTNGDLKFAQRGTDGKWAVHKVDGTRAASSVTLPAPGAADVSSV